ncbi:lysine 2,3-aminomutase [Bradyrhizobium japonicum]|uniref:Lysine 2,3-aminomutase n=2 Tax=Bradyrhizobium japonicum TaxID=375 RepID=A0A0A3YHN0_BRAJP|nr:lysine 2,3-aminomutase [Bradyrhizobium japonicum]
MAQTCDEPDWTRIPGFRDVTRREWECATWQRKHAVKNLRQLKDALRSMLPASLAESIARDQRERAGMPILLPPHVLSTMNMDDLWNDPVRRYMLPAYDDRSVNWAVHPKASRDSLHEQEMWVVEGLTHRYPNKVLVELIATCPQYCGHCTRMHLVGKDVPQATKVKFGLPPRERQRVMLEYLEATPSIRDVVVSGGDVANVPLEQLEAFIGELLRIPTIRDIRLASKGLVGLPQHYLKAETLAALERIAREARLRGVNLALHTHANHLNQITPLVGKASTNLLDIGLRDVRNQGVLLDGVNATSADVLDLCLGLLDRTMIMPYYFFMCDIIPHAEHWRISLERAQTIQSELMGLLPGYATPRIVCDVPYIGKRWVHQATRYDRVRGISYWMPNPTLAAESNETGEARRYAYYDPIRTLPAEGQDWWQSQMAEEQ